MIKIILKIYCKLTGKMFILATYKGDEIDTLSSFDDDAEFYNAVKELYFGVVSEVAK
jgi:hypothetical protein